MPPGDRLEVIQEAEKLARADGRHPGDPRYPGLVYRKIESGEASEALARGRERRSAPKTIRPATPRPELPPTDPALSALVGEALSSAVGAEAFGRYFAHQVRIRATAAAAWLLVPTGMVAELVRSRFGDAIAAALAAAGAGELAGVRVDAGAFAAEVRP